MGDPIWEYWEKRCKVPSTPLEYDRVAGSTYTVILTEKLATEKDRQARARRVRFNGSGETAPEIAAMGGRATKNRSFSKNRELAAEAGRKGGKAVPAASRTFSNVRIAKEAGRKGGSATQANSIRDAKG